MIETINNRDVKYALRQYGGTRHARQDDAKTDHFVD